MGLKARGSSRPFAYYGEGIAGARKHMSLMVRFAVDVADADRLSIEGAAPGAIADGFDWVGRTMWAYHDRDSLQWVVAADYPNPGPRAAEGEATAEQWVAFNRDIDRWLLEIHASRPLEFVIKPIDEEYWTDLGPWHAESIAASPERWASIEASSDHPGPIEMVLWMWRMHVAELDPEVQRQVIDGLGDEPRAILARRGGVPEVYVEPVEPESPTDDDCEAALAEIVASGDPAIEARFDERFDGRESLLGWVGALQRAGRFTRAVEICDLALGGQVRFRTHWWSALAQSLVGAGDFERAKDVLPTAMILAESYLDGAWVAMIRYLEATGDPESAAIAYHGARIYVSSFGLERPAYGTRAPVGWAEAFEALYDRWIREVFDVRAMSKSLLAHCSVMFGKLGQPGGPLTSKKQQITAEIERRNTLIDAVVARAGELRSGLAPALASLDVHPDDVTMSELKYALWTSGGALAKAGDHAGAAAVFEMLRPLGEAWVYGNLLSSLLALGELDRAQTLVEPATALAPENPYLFHSLAILAARRGESGRALELVDAAAASGYAELETLRAQVGALT